VSDLIHRTLRDSVGMHYLTLQRGGHAHLLDSWLTSAL